MNEENKAIILTPDEILTRFESEHVPSKSAPLYYRLGIIFVAIMMILLPLIYLGLIGLSGYAIFYHAVYNIDVLYQSQSWGDLFLYFGPLIIGIIGILFLIKPLFIPPPKPPQQFILEPGIEPAFETFIYKIADAVGAPRPKQIELDCNVNAAASFRRGLQSIFSQDLTLLIGMPLMAGMTLRSFGGVLAHEFGHFSQSAGMRMTYIIRNINAWFSRVVYERDQLDVWLEQTASNIDIRLGIIFHLARLFVWLARRVLWVLMWVGHTISCFTLRQMEFDADRYEVGFAGSEVFKDTSDRLQELSVGLQRTIDLLHETWRQGQISDNIPDLSIRETERLPEDVLTAIQGAQKSQKTGLFDTHPCDTDRIKAAEALKQPGIFRLQEPASLLLNDWDGLNRTVTRHYYKHVLELNVEDTNLVGNEDLIGQEQEMTDEAEAIDYFFNGQLDFTRPVFITEEDFAASKGSLVRLKEELDELEKTCEAFFEAYAKNIEERVLISMVHELVKAGFQIKASDFGLSNADEAYLYNELNGLKNTLNRLVELLTPFDEKVRQTLIIAINHDEVTARKAAPWVALSETIKTIYPDVLELQDLVNRNDILLQQTVGQTEIEQQHSICMSINASAMDKIIQNIRPVLERTTYPFEHAKGEITLWEFVSADTTVDPEADRIVKTYVLANALTSQFFRLYQRVLGQLAMLGKAAMEEVTPVA